MSVPLCECGHLLYEEHDETGEHPCLVPECKCASANAGDDEEPSNEPFEDDEGDDAIPDLD